MAAASGSWPVTGEAALLRFCGCFGALEFLDSSCAALTREEKEEEVDNDDDEEEEVVGAWLASSSMALVGREL